jgi:CIC family chloride channel protein
LDRYQSTEALVLVGTALLVGLGTGLGALGFIWLLGVLQRFFRLAGDWLRSVAGPAGLILVPVLGAVIAGQLIAFFAREAKGHGLPEVMEAVALRFRRIRPAVAVLNVLASAAASVRAGRLVGKDPSSRVILRAIRDNRIQGRQRRCTINPK